MENWFSLIIKIYRYLVVIDHFMRFEYSTKRRYNIGRSRKHFRSLHVSTTGDELNFLRGLISCLNDPLLDNWKKSSKKVFSARLETRSDLFHRQRVFVRMYESMIGPLIRYGTGTGNRPVWFFPAFIFHTRI